MDTRKLLSATALYGAADVLVLAVSGFLLLPLYTRALSQAEFGTYVAIKANIDIFTYLIFLGLPSAVSRIYFDYRKSGHHAAYMSSVLLFFGLCLTVLLLLLVGWGDSLWLQLSPSIPVYPYLVFSVALAATGFLSTMGTLWLRLEGRARAFVVTQVSTAAVLTCLVSLNLLVLNLGLVGILWALLISTAIGGALLPWLFGQSFRLAIDWSHIRNSMTYAWPSLLGYVAYFLLNRISTLVLQRHASMEDIAVFGLSQQLALILTVASSAFGKAQQPLVFGAKIEQAPILLERTAQILRLSVLALVSFLMLFSSELLNLIAPSKYGDGLPLLLILLIGGLANAFSQASDSALLYHRKPRYSLAVLLLGALVSTGLCLLLIPEYHVIGAATAVTCAFITMSAASHFLAQRLTGKAYITPLLAGLTIATVIALPAYYFSILGWSSSHTSLLKLTFFAGLAFIAGRRYTFRQDD